jgi:hypothetical protein
MANYFPIEFLGIFTVFYATYKLKLHKYVISFLFRKQVIYLPLNDNDFDQLMQLSKEYKDNKKQGKVLIRSCEFKEYSEKSNSQKYLDFDFLIFLYLCNFVITFCNTFYKILRLCLLGHEKNPFLINEPGKNNFDISMKDVNFSLYLTISFIIYVIYREIKKYIFAQSFFSKPAKEFYECFTVCFVLFFINEYFNEKLFNLNYDEAIDIINNRIDLILTQSKVNYNFNVEKIHVKILFSFIFGLTSGIFLRATERGAYFDNFFCNVSNSAQLSMSQQTSPGSFSSENEEKNEIKIEYIAKIKSISNLIILVILFEPLLDNFLEVIYINNYLKKIIIIFGALFIDFVLGFYILWYAYFMFSVQNYQKIMEFVKNPNSKYLNTHKNIVNYINENAWDVLSHVFINCFLPFYVFICYANQINIFNKIVKINDNDTTDLNKGFINNVLFIVFLAFQISKGIIENVIFYYRLIIQEKHLAIF